MSFYTETKHRSRKERRCEATGARIHVGDEYVSCRGVCEGDFFSVSCSVVGLDAYRKCYGFTDDDPEPLTFNETLEFLIDSHVSDQLTEEAKAVAELDGVPQWFKDRVAKLNTPAA